LCYASSNFVVIVAVVVVDGDVYLEGDGVGVDFISSDDPAVVVLAELGVRPELIFYFKTFFNFHVFIRSNINFIKCAE
jgi:hypothetical protein